MFFNLFNLPWISIIMQVIINPKYPPMYFTIKGKDNPVIIKPEKHNNIWDLNDKKEPFVSKIN